MVYQTTLKEAPVDAAAPRAGSAAPAARGTAPISLDSSTLPMRVAEQVRNLVTEGALAPGARLNERALCLRLGISRTPLREAFRLLAADGVIVLRPNRGAEVVMLSDEDIRQSFEVMSGLEAMSGELACAHVTDEELAEIRALTFEMLACHARRDLPNYYRINSAIHHRIVAAARNAVLAEVYERLNRRIEHLRFRSNLDHEKWDRAARDHVAMVDALAARDGVALAKLLRNHIVDKGSVVTVDRTPVATAP